MSMCSAQTPPPKATPPTQSGGYWRDIAVLGGVLALVLFGLAGLATVTGWEEMRAQVMRLNAGQVAILLGLSLANYLFRGARWHVFTRRLGLPTGIMQDLRHFLGGFAMSVTPGRVGELIRLRWLRRETGWSLDRTAPLVLVDRACDLAAMALILGGAVALSAGGMTLAFPVAIGALALSVIATRPRLLTACVSILYRILGRFARPLARLRRAARSLSVFSNGPVLGAALALGAVGWFAEGAAFHLLLMWMGADLGLAKAVAIFTFATLAGGLTGAPGGLGGAEAAMVALLSLEGVPLDVSIPVTAIIRLTTLWFAIVIGLLVFPVAEYMSGRRS